MKCKNCGANYMLRELKCPYCGTENAIGRIWHAQRTEAELEYERRRIAEGRKINPYVTTRALSRIIILQILVLIVLSIVSYAFEEWTYRSSYDTLSGMKTEKLRETVRLLYEAKDYRQMEEMAPELYRRSEYKDKEARLYAAVARAVGSYDDFLVTKMRLENMSKEEMNEDKYLLRSAIYDAYDCQHSTYYYYDEPIPSELEEILDKNRENARIWLCRMCGDKEMVDDMLASDYLLEEGWDAIEKAIRINNGWAQVLHSERVEDAG